jgi:hypothetical protein
MHDSGRATGAYTKIACIHGTCAERGGRLVCQTAGCRHGGDSIRSNSFIRSSNIARVHNRRQKVQENQHIQASRALPVPARSCPPHARLALPNPKTRPVVAAGIRSLGRDWHETRRRLENSSRPSLPLPFPITQPFFALLHKHLYRATVPASGKLRR